jgi:hypothetical protein
MTSEYFSNSLNNVRPKFGMAPAWPDEWEMDRLTDRAAGLFIWATTAMAFMEETWDRNSPATKLDLILAGHLGKHDNLDVLYQPILDFYFSNADDLVFELFRAVIGTVIIAKTPSIVMISNISWEIWVMVMTGGSTSFSTVYLLY